MEFGWTSPLGLSIFILSIGLFLICLGIFLQFVVGLGRGWEEYLKDK